MKKWFGCGIVALLMGCASAALAGEPASLVGTWEGESTVHSATAGYQPNKMVFTIEEQKGHVFRGNKTYVQAATSKKRTEEVQRLHQL